MSYTQNEEQPPPEEEGVPEQQPAPLPEPEQPPLAPNVTHVGKTQEEEEDEATAPDRAPDEPPASDAEP